MTELALVKDTPALATPTLANLTIQNTMPSSDDKLYVSTHGDADLKWIQLATGEMYTVQVATYFMQTGRDNWVFPVIEFA